MGWPHQLRALLWLAQLRTEVDPAPKAGVFAGTGKVHGKKLFRAGHANRTFVVLGGDHTEPCSDSVYRHIVGEVHYMAAGFPITVPPVPPG